MNARNDFDSFKRNIFRYCTPVPWSGCWVWTKFIEWTGYGVVKISGKNYHAHRAAWLAFNGEIPNKLFILHRCDERSCVNPDHLFLGTALDNSNDMKAKGRERKATGQNHPRARLSNESVLYIRNSTESGVALAKRFNVCPSTIGYARRKETWREI